jgi:hypothetical protein
VAQNRSFLVPKSRKIYGCEMPALVAMASVDVPAYPDRANSTMAARKMDARRTSALCRIGTMPPMLVSTHKRVKGRETLSSPATQKRQGSSFATLMPTRLP